VSEVLTNATQQFGQGFADVVATSKVWVNGEEVPLSHPVGDNDEVAVLPPVSGGM
jgi:molybdopterin converting factor small subunit